MTAQDTNDTTTGTKASDPAPGEVVPGAGGAANDAAPAVADGAEAGGPISAGPAPADGAGRDRVSTLTVLLAALCVAAAACAGWSGWSWYRAAHAAPPASAQLRDRVLEEGEQAVQNFNTLDYRHVSQGLALWLSSSAGALHTEVAQGRTEFAQQVGKSRTITTARVLDGALTRLNARAGTASLIVALQLTVTPAAGSPVVKLNRLQATLARTASGWLLTSIGQVPAGGSGTGG